jgi:predicted DNA-binding transcriptional regulator AlpA
MLNPLAALAHSPDFAVLTKQQTAVVTNTSTDTLDRLHESGNGPERVQLSPRRVGYTVGAIRKWLAKRTSTNVAA